MIKLTIVETHQKKKSMHVSIPNYFSGYLLTNLGWFYLFIYVKAHKMHGFNGPSQLDNSSINIVQRDPLNLVKKIIPSSARLFNKENEKQEWIRLWDQDFSELGFIIIERAVDFEAIYRWIDGSWSWKWTNCWFPFGQHKRCACVWGHGEVRWT